MIRQDRLAFLKQCLRNGMAHEKIAKELGICVSLLHYYMTALDFFAIIDDERVVRGKDPNLTPAQNQKVLRDKRDKMLVAGYGTASKQEVLDMVKELEFYNLDDMMTYIVRARKRGIPVPYRATQPLKKVVETEETLPEKDVIQSRNLPKNPKPKQEPPAQLKKKSDKQKTEPIIPSPLPPPPVQPPPAPPVPQEPDQEPRPVIDPNNIDVNHLPRGPHALKDEPGSKVSVSIEKYESAHGNISPPKNPGTSIGKIRGKMD